MGLFTAASQFSCPTPFGLALLDPASLAIVASGVTANDRLWPLPVVVPTDPALVGFPLLTQGLALVPSTLRATGLAITVVEP